MNDQEPLFADGKDLPGFHSLLGYRQVSWEEDEAVLELFIFWVLQFIKHVV